MTHLGAKLGKSFSQNDSPWTSSGKRRSVTGLPFRCGSSTGRSSSYVRTRSSVVKPVAGKSTRARFWVTDSLIAALAFSVTGTHPISPAILSFHSPFHSWLLYPLVDAEAPAREQTHSRPALVPMHVVLHPNRYELKDGGALCGFCGDKNQLATRIRLPLMPEPHTVAFTRSGKHAHASTRI